MKVLMVEPMKAPYTTELNNTLDNLQKAVDGYIQVLYPFDDSACIICNEEGKLTGLPLNRAVRDDSGEIYDILAGTFIITGLTEDDFCSLSDSQLDEYTRMFQHPETFMKIGREIFAIPV